jgi:hypothetical protein
VISERSGGHEPRCFRLILRHAAALLVEGGKGILSFRDSALRGAAEQLGRARKILGEQPTFEINEGEVVGRRRVAKLGRGGELCALPAVGGADAPAEMNMASANIASRSLRSARAGTIRRPSCRRALDAEPLA